MREVGLSQRAVPGRCRCPLRSPVVATGKTRGRDQHLACTPPLRSPVVATGKTADGGITAFADGAAATEPGRRDREDDVPVGRALREEWVPLRSPVVATGKTWRGAGSPFTQGSCRYGARPSRPGRLRAAPGPDRDARAATEPGRRDREDVDKPGGLSIEFIPPLRSPVVATGKTTRRRLPRACFRTCRYGARSSRPGGRRGPLHRPRDRRAATEPGRRDREDSPSPRTALCAALPPLRSPVVATGKTPRPSDPPLSTATCRYGARSSRPGRPSWRSTRQPRHQPLRSPVVATGKTFLAQQAATAASAATEPGRRDREDLPGAASGSRGISRYGARSSRPGRPSWRSKRQPRHQPLRSPVVATGKTRRRRRSACTGPGGRYGARSSRPRRRAAAKARAGHRSEPLRSPVVATGKTAARSAWARAR